MEHIETQSREHLIIGALALLTVASLPLLAVLVFTLRAALLLVALAALVWVLVGYAISPAFREWCTAHLEPLIAYKGLRLATDVKFHPNHSWVRTDGDVWVGVDDVVQAALGPVEKVQLPPEGLVVRQGDRLFQLRRGDRVIDVRSPVSGTVMGVNLALRGHPELINQEPFYHGWVVRLRNDRRYDDRRQLLRGRRARTWFHQAVDRVIGLLPDTVDPPSSDERGRARQLYRHIDDGAWRQLIETMFAPQPTETVTRP